MQSNHPFLLLSQQLEEICRPLEAFGIHHFTYLKQYRNGERISLSNKPAWIEAYYNLKLYDSSLFEEPKEGSLSSFNLWFGDYDLDVYRHGRLYFNTMHSISIVEHSRNYIETYLFATSPDNPESIHYLSNNRDILYHFIMYMKDRGKNIFTKAEKHKFTIEFQDDDSSKKYEDWFQNTELAKKLDQEKRNYFNNTPVHQFTFNTKNNSDVRFSNRELSCIKHLLNFKNASETAALMNISVRTVESYLNNIKCKLGCNTKAEILAILNSSKYFS